MTPELALVGYLPRDLLLSSDFVAAAGAGSNDSPRDIAGGPPTLVGLPEPNPSDEGRPLFNSAALLDDGSVRQRFRKALLPTYDVFDEDRYFEPFHGAQMLDIGGRRLGISICEDIWNDRDFWKRRRYHHDPVEELVRAGAEAIVNLSASPFSAGKHGRREQMLGSMARKYGVPLVYVNQFGGNDDLVFDGRSCGFNRSGEPIARGRSFDGDVVLCDLDGGADCGRRGSRSRSPRSGGRWCSARATTRASAGSRGWCSGLSGGIDSALTAAIAAEALGAGQRARRADAVAVLEPRQHRRFARAGAQPRHRDADAADRGRDAGDGAHAARRRSRAPRATSPKRTSRRASAATC